MKEYKPIVWSIYKDSKYHFCQYNTVTQDYIEMSDVVRLADIIEAYGSKKLELPSKFVFKKESKGYNNDLIVKDRKILELINWLQNRDRTLSASYINSSSLSHHKALTLSAYHKTHYRNALVCSIGKGRDFENLFLSRFEDNELVEDYSPTWLGFYTSFLYWLAHSCVELIDCSPENYLDAVLDLELEEPKEDAEERRKNFKAMLRNRPDYLQWKVNNFFKQHNPLQEWVNTDKKRKKVFENVEQEKERLFWGRQAVYECIIELFTADSKFKEYEHLDTVILTGEAVKHPKLFRGLKSYYSKIPLITGTVAHGMAVDGEKNQGIGECITIREPCDFEDAQQKYNRAEVFEQFKNNKKILFVTSDLSAFVCYQDCESKQKIYELTTSDKLKDSTFFIENESVVIPTKKKDLYVLKSTNSCLFTRFLDIPENEVFGYKIKFDSRDEMIKKAQEDNCLVLIQGTNNSYEY